MDAKQHHELARLVSSLRNDLDRHVASADKLAKKPKIVCARVESGQQKLNNKIRGNSLCEFIGRKTEVLLSPDNHDRDKLLALSKLLNSTEEIQRIK